MSNPRTSSGADERADAAAPEWTHDGVPLDGTQDTSGARFQRTEESPPPKIIAHYELVEKLGEGGMGAVYKGWHPKMQRFGAVKLLPSELMKNPALLARFEHEIALAAQLDHPHVVRTFDAGEENGVHYLVLEYLEGTDLSKLVKQGGPLSLENALTAVHQAALGLHHAHEKGLVHRDIKPANLMLHRPASGARGPRATSSEIDAREPRAPQPAVVKVMDFGLALLADSNSMTDLTKTGQIMGTPEYMAPEQWESTHDVDARADLYSLGATLHFLLLGRSPYRRSESTTVLHLMKSHALYPIPDLTAPCPDIPPEVNALFQRLMAKSRADRPSSALEVANAIEAIQCSIASRHRVHPGGSRASALPASAPANADSASPDSLAPPVAQKRGNHPGEQGGGSAIEPTQTLSDLFDAIAADQRTVTLAPTIDRSHQVDSLLRDGNASHGVTRLRSRPRLLIAVALAAVVVLAGIIIKIKHKDGSVTEIKIPDGATVEVIDEKSRMAAPGRPAVPNNPANTKSTATEKKSEDKTAEGGHPTPNSYRRVAEAVLRAGGTLELVVGPSLNDRVTVTKLDDLPDRPFIFYVIDLTNRREWTDQQQQLLRDVHWLGTLKLTGTLITDAAMEPIADLAGYDLHFSSTAITDGGIERFGSSSGWSVVYSGTTKLTDVACERFAEMTRLRRLFVSGTQITDTGFRQLAKTSSLQWLQPGVSMTAESLNVLSELPQLRVLSLTNHTSTAIVDLVPTIEGIRSLRFVILPPSIDAADACRLQISRPELIVGHPDVPVPDSDRSALQWVLDQGGSLFGNKSPMFGFDAIAAADLKQPFAIGQIKVDHAKAPTSGVEHLRGLRYVEDIFWPRLRLDDSTTEQLASFVTLQRVYGDPRPLTALGLKRLTMLPYLDVLTLNSAPTLEDDDWAALSRAPFLRRLVLNVSALRDGALAQIGQCPNLDWLELSGCRNVTHAGLVHLESLPWLWTLDLRANPQLDDRAVEPLSRIKTLRVLCLSGTNLTPAGLTRLNETLPKCAIFATNEVLLPQSRMAALGRPAVPNIASNTKNKKSQEDRTAEGGHSTNPDRAAAEWVLSLKDADSTSVLIQVDSQGGGEKRVRRGESLPEQPFQLLDVSVTSAALTERELDTHLPPLARLKNLELHQCTGITDGSVPTILKLRSLRRLQVFGLSLTPSGCIALITGLPLLQEVGVSAKHLTPELIDLICSTSRVKIIAVMAGSDRGTVTDSQIRKLFGAKQLQELYLLFAPLEMATWRELPEGLPNLRGLGVQGRHITDEHLLEFSRWPKLEFLSIPKTAITDAGLSALHGSRTLKTLDLSKTIVTAESVAALHAALPNCRITWDGGVIEPAP